MLFQKMYLQLKTITPNNKHNDSQNEGQKTSASRFLCNTFVTPVLIECIID